jgi:hypothetical protein
MEQRHSWEMVSHSANKKYLSYLWNPEIYSRFHKSPSVDPHESGKQLREEGT